MSRPVWGAWIEINFAVDKLLTVSGRAPYGARGLKSQVPVGLRVELSRAPYGARGLKYRIRKGPRRKVWRRAPYGARGLKFVGLAAAVGRGLVAPRMGRVD